MFTIAAGVILGLLAFPLVVGALNCALFILGGLSASNQNKKDAGTK